MWSITQIKYNDNASLLSQIDDCLTFGFSDLNLYKIDIQLLEKVEEQLLKFSECDAQDIENIWENDVFSTENEAEYMVDRFRDRCSDPVIFYTSCIVGEQKHLLSKYFDNLHLKDMCRISEFLKWIRYMLGVYDIKNLSNDINIVNVWKQSPVAVFFFRLDKDLQIKLVDKYNLSYI